MRSQFDELKAKWENEKASIGKVQKLREELEDLNVSNSSRAISSACR